MTKSSTAPTLDGPVDLGQVVSYVNENKYRVAHGLFGNSNPYLHTEEGKVVLAAYSLRTLDITAVEMNKPMRYWIRTYDESLKEARFSYKQDNMSLLIRRYMIKHQLYFELDATGDSLCIIRPDFMITNGAWTFGLSKKDPTRIFEIETTYKNSLPQQLYFRKITNSKVRSVAAAAVDSEHKGLREFIFEHYRTEPYFDNLLSELKLIYDTEPELREKTLPVLASACGKLNINQAVIDLLASSNMDSYEVINQLNAYTSDVEVSHSPLPDLEC